MEERTYSEIVQELHNLSSQGVPSDDVRFVHMLAQLSLEREKHGSLDGETCGVRSTARNPVNRAQFDRLLDQIDLVANYLSVGINAPKDILHRCGVDAHNVNREPKKRDGSIKKEILYYAEVLHRNGDYWRSNLVWVEYNEVMVENAIVYRVNALNTMRSAVQYALASGTQDGVNTVEIHIQRLGMHNFAAKYRVNGMLRMDELLAGIIRLERQLHLLILQKNFKRAMRFSRHLYLPKPSNPSAWSAPTRTASWAENVANFITRHSEAEKARSSLAKAASQSLERLNKKAEAVKLMKNRNIYTPAGWEEKRSKGDYLRHRKKERLNLFYDKCQTYMKGVLHVTVIEHQYPDYDQGSLYERHASTSYALKNPVIQYITRLPHALCVSKIFQIQHRDGLSWLLHLYNYNLNCVLADDYKLNRVLHVVALLAYIKEMKAVSGPHLIIAPMAAMESIWLSGLEEWYPACIVCAYIGGKSRRRSINATWPEMGFSKPNFDVLFTNDHVFMQDHEILKRIKWEYIIVDGLQILANPYNHTLRYINQGFVSRRRLLLATEPLQTTVLELWPVVNFLFPDMYKSADPFHIWFVEPYLSVLEHDDLDAMQPNEKELESIGAMLNNVVSPFILCRSEAAYLELNPKCTQHIVYCPMSGVQTKLFDFFNKYYMGNDMFRMLKRICDHPYALCPDTYPCDDSLFTISGKFAMLDICMSRLANARRRTIIITPDEDLLNLVETLMHLRAIKYLRIDRDDAYQTTLQKVGIFNNRVEEFMAVVCPMNACHNLMLTCTETVICFDGAVTPNFVRENNILKEEDVIILRLAVPNVTDNGYLMQHEVELPPSVLKPKPSYSAARRKEFMSGALHSLSYLDRIMMRSSEDERLFFLSDIHRYLSQVVLLVDELMVPPSIFKVLAAMGAFREEELSSIKIEDQNWYNMMDTYDVWSTNPNDVLLERLRTYYNPETSISTYNTITGLPLCYPIDRTNSIRGIMDTVLTKHIKVHTQQRALVINHLIVKALDSLMNLPEYVMFTDYYMPRLYGSYLKHLEQPVSLNDIRSLAAECVFPSVGGLSMFLERLSRNVRACHGSRSEHFFRSLDLYYQINNIILKEIPVSFLWLIDRKVANELQRFCEDIQRLYE